MTLKNTTPTSKWPTQTTMAELTTLAKARFGDSLISVAKHTYGGGSQVEVRRVKNGYHGRQMCREVCYEIVGE